MATFTRYVVESRSQTVKYTIEAKDDAEADRKAVIGETEAEEEIGDYEVANREIASTGA